MRAFVVGACLLVACKGGSDSNKKAEAKPAGETPPQVGSAAEVPKPGLATVNVTIDDKPATLARAFIKRLPGGKWFQIYATSDGGSCKELLDNLFNEPGDEQSILFDVTERLAPDGTRALAVSSVHYRGSLDQEPGATVAIAGSADPGAQVEVTVDYVAKYDGRTWATKGTFIAEGCGDDAPDAIGVPKAKHASAATITVAGQPFPLVGATRTGKNLVLSTGPKDCSPATPFAPVVLTHQNGKWELAGTLFATRSRAIDNSIDEDTMKAVEITAGKAGTSDDGPTVELALAGEGNVGDYPVKLEGTIEAIECPK